MPLLFFLGSLQLYQCCYCTKIYTKENSLYKHRKYECGQQPKYICPHCPYKSIWQANFKRHIANKHLNKHIWDEHDMN